MVAREFQNRFDLALYDGGSLVRQATLPNTVGLDSGFLGIVGASDGSVVVARHNIDTSQNPPTDTWDLLRYGQSGSNMFELNSGISLAGLDSGFLGMVASRGNHVVMARHDSGAFDLVRYDVDPPPSNQGFPNIVQANRGERLAGLDDGLLGMVATARDDVIMIRQTGSAWELLRYDVTANPIVELNRNDSARGLDNGFLGAAALGNGDIVLGRHGANNQIELFLYDGVTLAEKANNLSDLRGIDSGFIGMTGFSFIDIPEPTTLALIVSGLIMFLARARRRSNARHG